MGRHSLVACLCIVFGCGDSAQPAQPAAVSKEAKPADIVYKALGTGTKHGQRG